MRTAWSLRTRIFLACAILAALSLGFAFAFVNFRATSEAEADLRRRLEGAAGIADQHRQATLTHTFTIFARLVADLPRLKAAVDTRHPPTIQQVVDEYREQLGADVLVVSSPAGTVVGSGQDAAAVMARLPDTDAAGEHVLLVPYREGLLQIVSVPIQIGVSRTELLGRLAVGFVLDHTQFAQVTSSEIAFGGDGRILASTLPPDTHDGLRPLLSAETPTPATLRGVDYLALAKPMGEPGAGPGGGVPVLLVLRSRSEGLQFLGTLRAGLAGALLVALVLATVASWVVARTITRPLAAVTGAMAHVAATGDLTRRVSLQSRAGDDQDARLLVAAFNRLTESIARFKQEETHKERLSSLGRLSTVIAHEIRNPLMIIRASLRTLRRATVSPAELRDAVADIDEETARLNRIVTEVLDFARPMRFDLAETQVNDICRTSAAAAGAGDSDVDVVFDLDPHLPCVVTDAERLRTVLVNILTNARAAVKAVAEPDGPDPRGGLLTASAIEVATRRDRGRVLVTIRDRGVGIGPDDMAHIFDPYFTTRRTGTGLGLPIAKNIVEGLGGAIAVRSRPGEGTDIEIALPLHRPETAA